MRGGTRRQFETTFTVQSPPDNKAIAIVKHALWAKGWRNSPLLTGEERAYLEVSGYILQDSKLSHDQCLAWAHNALAKVTKEQVANAFVWSLGSRQLEYRSALGSFAHLHLMPQHDFVRTPVLYNDYCAVCGCRPMAIQPQTFLAENFERHMWGGVRHDDLSYMAFDLDCFSQLSPETPSQNDWELLAAILKAAADPVDGKTNASLKKRICKIIKSNTTEAGILCQILAYAGILKPDDCPAYNGNYIRFDQRGDGRPRSDLKYPLSWWRGTGFCSAGVEYWFPWFKGSISSQTRPSQPAVASARAKSTAPPFKHTERRPNNQNTNSTKISPYPFLPRSNAYLLPGQFFSFRLSNGRYACGRVLEKTWPIQPGSRTIFKVGLMDWCGDSPAMTEDLAGRRVLEEGYASPVILRDYGATIDGYRAFDLDWVVPDSSQNGVYGREVLRIIAHEHFGGEKPVESK